MVPVSVGHDTTTVFAGWRHLLLHRCSSALAFLLLVCSCVRLALQLRLQPLHLLLKRSCPAELSRHLVMHSRHTSLVHLSVHHFHLDASAQDGGLKLTTVQVHQLPNNQRLSLARMRSVLSKPHKSLVEHQTNILYGTIQPTIMRLQGHRLLSDCRY